MSSFAAQHSLFRAYDIRGSHQYFTDEFVQALGYAFAHLYNSQDRQLTQRNHTVIDIDDCKNSTMSTKQGADIKSASIKSNGIESTDIKSAVTTNIVVIGYDMRVGSETIARALSTTLTKKGLRVIQLGLITTPMMAFWSAQYQGHGIVVTASHSAKDILGIKWVVNHKSPNSSEIQTLYQQLIAHHNYYSPKRQYNKAILDSSFIDTVLDTESSSYLLTELPARQVADAYITAIEEVFEQLSYHNQEAHNQAVHNQIADSQTAPTKTPKNSLKHDLTIVIDCMHGATGNIAQRLFERFCQQVIVLNGTPDGSFPLGNPDPSEPNRLTELQQAVISHHADMGLAFDGDGDRLVVVDNDGKVVTPDYLLYFLARIALTEHPKPLLDSLLAPKVLFDVKCTHHLPQLLTDLRATPVISKTGSSFMRQQIQHPDSQVVFAGELSGHFIFNDSRFIAYDDAMYAALRLLHRFDQSRHSFNNKKSLTDIMQRLPAMVSTADHYLPMPQATMTDCTIIDQLTNFCTYLQHLVGASVDTVSINGSVSNSISKSEQPLKVPDIPAALCKSSMCACATVRSHIAVGQAKSLFPIGTKLNCIDGIRLDFVNGFGVLRQSNTSNNLTARFAGDSMDDLKDIQATFAALCRPFSAALAHQIVTMPAE